MFTAPRVPPADISESHPPFSPPWLYRNGHIQTLAGLYLYAPRRTRPQSAAMRTTMGEVLLPDGDRLVYQDDCPASWQKGDRIALLLHGLGGSHASPYMVRIAAQLNDRSMRTFRLDWRGCGAGAGLARYPYHSGRSDDVAATITQLQNLCPNSPISLIGFSLGGNVALKLLGEQRKSAETLSKIDRAIAVCPPIDLHFSVTSMQRGWSRLYDRYFCRTCARDVSLRLQQWPDTVIPEGWHSRRPRTLYEFDETYTAPVSGFASAADYYARSSAKQFLADIGVRTLIMTAQDDPLIPFSQFRNADFSPSTSLLAPRYGGHLGFCTFRGQHWLDQQIMQWAIPVGERSPR
jgi:predicted alpha/beta-fold hydrolase